MKLSSRHRQDAGRIELSMTAMIDVVFLLLIFFIATTSFTKAEKQIRSAIQVKDQSEAQPSAGRLEPAVVEVLTQGGQGIYRIGSREFTELDELTRLLQAFENKDEGAFVIVHDGASFDMTAAALQACRTVGFPSVSYIPATAKP